MKIISKLLMLVFVLSLVVLFRQYLGGATVKEGLSAFFGISTANNSIRWCVDNTVDVLWTNADVPERLKQKSLSELRDSYCELPTEPIVGVDSDKVIWAPLAESRGPAGQLSKLEWNKDFAVFKAGGMPFKSSEFTTELQEKIGQ